MSGLAGLRVLVVENDEMNAMLLELQLQNAGATVIGTTGEIDQALRLIDQLRPGAVVLDYRLSNGQTSEAAARRLTSLHIPFILATGLSIQEVPTVFRAGGLLIKPYLAADLVRLLLHTRDRFAASKAQPN